MRYSRTGIVAVLVAAEIFIGGAIFWAVSGHGMQVRAAGFAGSADWQGKTFGAIDAGDAPHVVVNDPETRYVVEPSTDGKVHVSDQSSIHGWLVSGGTPAQLSVAKTGDGVSISRPGDGHMHFAIFGFSTRRVEVQLPAGSYLDVQRSGGADLSGLTGHVDVHSVDGSISLRNVHATELKIASDDGSLRMNDVAVPSIDASTQDGSIRANGLQTGGGRLQTQDGSIRVTFVNSNLSVHARTADGSLHFNGSRVAPDADAPGAVLQVGSGGGSLEVSTQDGSIHISSNGAL